MSTLKYVGTPAQYDSAGSSNDLVNQAYISYLLGQGLSPTQVTNQINTALAQFCLQTTATTSLLNGLATPTWIQSQENNYLAASNLGVKGGAATLNPTTGRVNKGLIVAPGGSPPQTWASPFWSPANYNTGTVTATYNSPTLLYSVPVQYPGYPYVLAVFGAVDVGVSANNGTQAEVFVTVGSQTITTGPPSNILAVGYGNAQSYLGPEPGSTSAQANLTAGSGIGPNWTTIPYWTGNNATGYSSTVVGNYLQAPSSGTYTLSAAVSFSGAYGGLHSAPLTIPYFSTPETTLLIITDTGTVLAVGESDPGPYGICHVSWTGAISAGQKFAIQCVEAGISAGVLGQYVGVYGSWTGGSFTISASSVPSTSPANVIPVPLASQTVQTGNSTVYVVLRSSDSANNTQVSASNLLPGLWVMPIPWTN
jgi:hypothetical protein